MKGIQKRFRLDKDNDAALRPYPALDQNSYVNAAIRDFRAKIKVDAWLRCEAMVMRACCLIEQSLRTSFGTEVDQKSAHMVLKFCRNFFRV